MCLIEERAGKGPADVSIGMITICPSTGDVVWDIFEGKNMIMLLSIQAKQTCLDTAMRIELEVGIFYSEQWVCAKHIHLDEAGAHETNRIVSPRKRSQRSNGENAIAFHGVSVAHIQIMSCHVIQSSVSSSGHRIRTEKFQSIMDYTDAFSKVSEFYTDKKKLGVASESFKSGFLRLLYISMTL